MSEWDVSVTNVLDIHCTGMFYLNFNSELSVYFSIYSLLCRYEKVFVPKKQKQPEAEITASSSGAIE